jgi:CheY-like chemotaxis protein
MVTEVSVLNRAAPTCAHVLLAKDHPAMAEDLRAVPAPAFDVVATVGDGAALVAAAALTPDVIVTDIAMPGLEA